MTVYVSPVLKTDSKVFIVPYASSYGTVPYASSNMPLLLLLAEASTGCFCVNLTVRVLVCQEGSHAVH